MSAKECVVSDMTDLSASDAARRDRTIAECNELRQENAELRAKYRLLALAAADLLDLVDADATFENRDLELYKYEAIVGGTKAFLRLQLAKAAKP